MELNRGTLADTNKDNDFFAIMKISSTIEPLINDALSVEIRILRKGKIESESASEIAKFVNKTKDRLKKAKLAKDIGIITPDRYNFISAIYQLRDRYAHNIKNIHLDIFEIIKKVEIDDNDIAFRLSGIEKKEKFAEILAAQHLRDFVYWRFAGFLSETLRVLKLPPFRGLFGQFADKGKEGEEPQP